MSDEARAALERLLAAAEARLPLPDDYRVRPVEAAPIRFGLISARFVVDECRKGLAGDLPPAGNVTRRRVGADGEGRA